MIYYTQHGVAIGSVRGHPYISVGSWVDKHRRTYIKIVGKNEGNYLFVNMSHYPKVWDDSVYLLHRVNFDRYFRRHALAVLL